MSGDNVVIDFDAPNNRGSTILGYIIYIRENNGLTYTPDSSCDGADPDVVSATSCEIPISTLRGGSYQIPWGGSIFAKLIAYNAYGQSLESDVGNGAVILTKPDAPVSLAETVSLRSATSITFSWTKGAQNGGSEVIDYRVTYD